MEEWGIILMIMEDAQSCSFRPGPPDAGGGAGRGGLGHEG